MANFSMRDFSSKLMSLSGSCISNADTNNELWLTATRNESSSSTMITAAVDSACKAVYNATKIRIHSPGTTSWNTSFTFTIQPPSPGALPGQFLSFAITASPAVGTPATAGLFNDSEYSTTSTPSFAVCFFTYWNNVSILVNEKFLEGSGTWNWNLDQFNVSLNRAYERVRSYKAWIDYDGERIELYVVGLDGPALKSVESRVFSEKLDLSNALPAECYVGFTAATTADDREIHQIRSWEFSSSAGSSPPPGMSTIGPGASAHHGTTINHGLIIGVSIGAPLLLLIIILIFVRRTILKSIYKRIINKTRGSSPKLRIFISHTGGDDGQAKNFPISLFEKLHKDPRYEVFIDRQMRKGVDFTAEIKREAQLVDLGIVVVTKEYFGKKWPMIELVEFVELYDRMCEERSVRVLPLFYMLTPENVRELVNEGYWETAWKSMATEEHPVDVEKWRRAVLQLCKLNGSMYKYCDGSREAEYIRDVLGDVESIFNEVQSDDFGCCGVYF